MCKRQFSRNNELRWLLFGKSVDICWLDSPSIFLFWFFYNPSYSVTTIHICFCCTTSFVISTYSRLCSLLGPGPAEQWHPSTHAVTDNTDADITNASASSLSPLSPVSPTYNTCHMKKGSMDFGAPIIKHSLFGPLYSFWKIIKT